MLSVKAEPFRVRVFWIETKVQAFVDILNATHASILKRENVELTQTFTYLGGVIRG